MGIYATPDDLRARLGVDANTLPDARAESLITSAEERVDRIAGAWPIRPDNGRKFNPAGLTTLYADAVRDATTILAAAVYANPNAFTLNAVDGKTGMVRGPDFELRSPTPLPPEGRAAFRDAAARLDNMGLRELTARMRP